jgi:phosphoglycerate dehydrogenase-like enzyme
MQSFLAGLDHPAFKEIIGKGIRLSKSSAQAIPIAEYVTGNAFSLLLPIEQQRAAQAQKEWTRTPYREIGETRWTVIGFGAIGPEIAKRVKPFGVHLTVVRRQSDDRGLADAVIPLADVGKVLPETDVVVLACALNDETRGLANDSFFEKMKKGAILINIARGALINSDALKRGLDRDQPRHAVLDVFEQEPLPTDNWMWSHPKIHISAHTSPNGSGTMRRGDELFLENLKRYLAGEKVLNEATKAEVGL